MIFATQIINSRQKGYQKEEKKRSQGLTKSYDMTSLTNRQSIATKNDIIS